jgi:acetyl esterase/lipase
MLAPLPGQAPTRADVPYVLGGSSAQSLDVYAPTGHPGFPTVLMVHGGSLTSGDKRGDSLPAVCTTLVAAGMGCASINYRLGPFPKWPAQPNDVAVAVAWVRHHIAEYAGDSTALVLLGHSSGCTLASILGTDPKYLASAGLSSDALAGVVAMGCTLSPVLPAVSDSARLRAFFTGSAALGTFGSLETFLDVDATAHVTARTPPTLVLIADNEQLNPPILERARAFETRMKGAGRRVEVDVLPDRKHYTALSEMRHADDPTLALLLNFVRGVAAVHHGF